MASIIREGVRVLLPRQNSRSSIELRTRKMASYRVKKWQLLLLEHVTMITSFGQEASNRAVLLLAILFGLSSEEVRSSLQDLSCVALSLLRLLYYAQSLLYVQCCGMYTWYPPRRTPLHSALAVRKAARYIRNDVTPLILQKRHLTVSSAEKRGEPVGESRECKVHIRKLRKIVAVAGLVRVIKEHVDEPAGSLAKKVVWCRPKYSLPIKLGLRWDRRKGWVES